MVRPVSEYHATSTIYVQWTACPSPHTLTLTPTLTLTLTLTLTRTLLAKGVSQINVIRDTLDER